MIKTFIQLSIALLYINCCFGQSVKKVKIGELQKIIAESKTPIIIDFWATFCVPCLEEIPLFEEALKEHKAEGLQLFLVSLDMQEAYPAKIKTTIGKQGIIAPVVWLDETNADYFCPKIDSAWSGGMPASLFVNNQTHYHKFFEEKLSREKLNKEIMTLLGKEN